MKKEVIKELEEFLALVDEIEFTGEEKNKLKQLKKDKELTKKIFTKVKNHLANKMLSEDISVEHVRGAVYTLTYIRGLFI